MEGGKQFTEAVLSQLLQYYRDIPYASRLTLSGGDPLASPNLTYYVISKFKECYPDKKIWLYTGYCFEEIAFNSPIFQSEKTIQNIVHLCDVIVDGKFLTEQRDITLQFKGSSNQRIINVKETMIHRQIILWKEK